MNSSVSKAVCGRLYMIESSATCPDLILAERNIGTPTPGTLPILITK